MKEVLREQLVAARRKHILKAAAEVFAQKGFYATTIKDIARVAGVADGTIYNYFENKNGLLLGLFDVMTQTVQHQVDTTELVNLDLRSFIKAHFQRALGGFQAHNFELFRVIVSEIMVNQELGHRFSQQILEPTIEMAKQYFEEWAAQNQVQFRHLDWTLRAISSLITGITIQRALGNEAISAQWDELPDLLTDLMMEGFEGQLT